MNLKKSFTPLAIAGLLLLGGVAAEAGTSYSATRNITVPGTNGSAYTASQTKSISNAASDLSISSITTFNKMDTRAIGPNGAGPWVRNTNVGRYPIPNPTSAGDTTYLQFSSDFLSNGMTVSFQWRSN